MELVLSLSFCLVYIVETGFETRFCIGKIKYLNIGANTIDSVDYPLYANKMAEILLIIFSIFKIQKPFV